MALIVPPLRSNESASSRPSNGLRNTPVHNVLSVYIFHEILGSFFFFLKNNSTVQQSPLINFLPDTSLPATRGTCRLFFVSGTLKGFSRISVHLLGIPVFRVLICIKCDKAKVLVLSLRSVWCHGNHVNAHASDTTIIIRFASAHDYSDRWDGTESILTPVFSYRQ